MLTNVACDEHLKGGFCLRKFAASNCLRKTNAGIYVA